jgi:hypothetical protein
MRQLARLRTDAGVFGCMGNHERYAGVEVEVVRSGRRKGVDFLRYEARRLRFGNASLNITGVGYDPSNKPHGILRV